MEIVTAPYRPAPSMAARLAVVLAILAPVTVLALLPIGFGLQRYVVTTDDMAPALTRGTLVLEREVPVGDLEVGDVITYAVPAGVSPTGSVTHRIVTLDGSHAQTQGDAEPQIDPWPVPLDGPTQARVVLAVPWVGFVYLALVDPGPWTVAGGVAVAAAVAVLLVARRHRRTGARRASLQVGSRT